MSNIVVDTNTLVQIISPRSRYHRIYQSLVDGTHHLCVTTEILEEYEEILMRLTRNDIAKTIMRAITENPSTIFITTYYHFGLIVSDPDDNKFVDCAFAAGADYLVSEDGHFKVLREISFPSLNLVTLDEFMKSRVVVTG